MLYVHQDCLWFVADASRVFSHLLDGPILAFACSTHFFSSSSVSASTCCNCGGVFQQFFSSSHSEVCVEVLKILYFMVTCLCWEGRGMEGERRKKSYLQNAHYCFLHSTTIYWASLITTHFCIRYHSSRNLSGRLSSCPFYRWAPQMCSFIPAHVLESWLPSRTLWWVLLSEHGIGLIHSRHTDNEILQYSACIILSKFWSYDPLWIWTSIRVQYPIEFTYLGILLPATRSI